MRVLLVGDGAREHILAEQLARSSELYVAMEEHNPGIESVSQKAYVCDFSNIEAIGSWAIKEKIDIALVTSEKALAKDLPDALHECGIALASPRSAGSVIGENTVYAFNLMEAAGIRMPRFFVCKAQKDVTAALKKLPNVVMKPAVRVEWKGTKIGNKDFKKKKDLMKHAKNLIKRHGSVILEELVDGESFTVQGFTDGKTLTVMPPVHAVKRALEGGKGELTEGMGGYSTGKLLPFMKEEDLKYAKSSLWNLIRVLQSKGVDYRGPIRGEFILSKKGVVMLDVYATLGDVATLNNFLVLKTQLGEVVKSIVNRSLRPSSFLDEATVVKYLVPEGYPKKTGGRKSQVVVDERELWNNGSKAYVDSLQIRKGKIIPTNERALAICARGRTIEEADRRVEGAIASIEGKLRHRSDIGSKDYIRKSMSHIRKMRGK